MAGIFQERKKAFQGIMVIFDTAVADAGVFQIKNPFKQLRGFDVDWVGFKLRFGKFTEGLDTEGVVLTVDVENPLIFESCLRYKSMRAIMMSPFA